MRGQQIGILDPQELWRALPRALRRAGNVDSVELKVTVAEGHHGSATVALGIDPLNAHIRQVYFFDTPDLTLNKRGIIVRARRIQCVGGDSVVKLRPVTSTKLQADFRRSRNLVVEVDAMPSSCVCSASLKRTLESAVIQAAVMGQRPLRGLFTKEQRAFFAAHAGDVNLNKLTTLGPVNVLKTKIAPAGFDRKITVEMWLHLDASPTLELSTRCRPQQAIRVASQMRRCLIDHGINLSKAQQTKTHITIALFSQRTNST